MKLNNNFTLNNQISPQKSKKCSNKLYQLKKIKLNRTFLKIITSAYIISKLDYSKALLTDLPKLPENKQQYFKPNLQIYR